MLWFPCSNSVSITGTSQCIFSRLRYPISFFSYNKRSQMFPTTFFSVPIDLNLESLVKHPVQRGYLCQMWGVLDLGMVIAQGLHHWRTTTSVLYSPWQAKSGFFGWWRPLCSGTSRPCLNPALVANVSCAIWQYHALYNVHNIVIVISLNQTTTK